MDNRGTAFAIGQFAEVIAAFVRALVTVVTNFDPKRLVQETSQRGEELSRLLVEALNKFLTEVTYFITIDYSLNLAQMIAAGKYDYANPDITAAHFPISGSGTVETETVLVHFGRSMNNEAVLAELERRNLEPAKIEEGLAFGAKHPDVQREFPVVCLGSVWQCHGLLYVAVLDLDGTGRRLALNDCDVRWAGDCRFAAHQRGK